MRRIQGDLYLYHDISMEDGVIPEFREITSEEKRVVGRPYLVHFARSIRQRRICTVGGCARKKRGTLVE